MLTYTATREKNTSENQKELTLHYFLQYSSPNPIIISRWVKPTKHLLNNPINFISIVFLFHDGRKLMNQFVLKDHFSRLIPMGEIRKMFSFMCAGTIKYFDRR